MRRRIRGAVQRADPCESGAGVTVITLFQEVFSFISGSFLLQHPQTCAAAPSAKVVEPLVLFVCLHAARPLTLTRRLHPVPARFNKVPQAHSGQTQGDHFLRVAFVRRAFFRGTHGGKLIPDYFAPRFARARRLFLRDVVLLLPPL
jgi:hypothetical protein